MEAHSGAGPGFPHDGWSPGPSGPHPNERAGGTSLVSGNQGFCGGGGRALGPISRGRNWPAGPRVTAPPWLVTGTLPAAGPRPAVLRHPSFPLGGHGAGPSHQPDTELASRTTILGAGGHALQTTCPLAKVVPLRQARPPEDQAQCREGHRLLGRGIAHTSSPPRGGFFSMETWGSSRYCSLAQRQVLKGLGICWSESHPFRPHVYVRPGGRPLIDALGLVLGPTGLRRHPDLADPACAQTGPLWGRCSKPCEALL